MQIFLMGKLKKCSKSATKKHMPKLMLRSFGKARVEESSVSSRTCFKSAISILKDANFDVSDYFSSSGDEEDMPISVSSSSVMVASAPHALVAESETPNACLGPCASASLPIVGTRSPACSPISNSLVGNELESQNFLVGPNSNLQSSSSDVAEQISIISPVHLGGYSSSLDPIFCGKQTIFSTLFWGFCFSTPIY